MAVKLPVVINEWTICLVCYKLRQPAIAMNTPAGCLNFNFRFAYSYLWLYGSARTATARCQMVERYPEMQESYGPNQMGLSRNICNQNHSGVYSQATISSYGRAQEQISGLQLSV